MYMYMYVIRSLLHTLTEKRLIYRISFNTLECHNRIICSIYYTRSKCTWLDDMQAYMYMYLLVLVTAAVELGPALDLQLSELVVVQLSRVC